MLLSFAHPEGKEPLSSRLDDHQEHEICSNLVCRPCHGKCDCVMKIVGRRTDIAMQSMEGVVTKFLSVFVFVSVHLYATATLQLLLLYFC
jgi:hypothetical protein